MVQRLLIREAQRLIQKNAWKFSDEEGRTLNGYHYLRTKLNNEGYTPLGLSASLGDVELFSSLISKTREVQWKFGPVTCNLYPLDELDTPFQSELKPEKENYKCAIQVIVYQQQVALLSDPHIKSLMKKKWDKFVQPIFFSRLVYTLFYLFFLTVSIFLRGNLTDGERIHEGLLESICQEPDNSIFVTKSCPKISFTILEYSPFLILYLCDFFVLFLAGFKLYSELREIYNSGLSKYFSGTGALLFENTTSLTHTFMIYLAFGIKGVC
eukprot:TRINITY_DN7331_c0_g2_i2.p1 TRINITY_DN7331_c0_g2~~TRINITY_DN7331_c0_g2_i2.p1  ORF type:complete len:268 (-),score=49.97 TRINITY_DN7331_c0_g2_i2:216-1019(-)